VHFPKFWIFSYAQQIFSSCFHSPQKNKVIRTVNVFSNRQRMNDWMWFRKYFSSVFFSFSGWKCTNDCAEVMKTRERIVREFFVPISSLSLPPSTSYCLMTIIIVMMNVSMWIYGRIFAFAVWILFAYGLFFDVSTLDNPPITVHTYMCVPTCVRILTI